MMEILASISAFLIATAAVWLMRIAQRNDRDHNNREMRAALYVRIMNGDIWQPRALVSDLASSEIYTLWSSYLATEQDSDFEPLQARLRKEYSELSISGREKNWAKPASMLMAVIAVCALVFSASEALAEVFPSAWRPICSRLYLCPIRSASPGTPNSHPRQAVVVLPTHSAPRPVFRVMPTASRPAIAARQPERGPHVVVTTARPPAVSPIVPHAAASECATLANALPCVIGKVATTGQCVLNLAQNLTNLGAFGVDVPNLGSTVGCVKTQLLKPSAQALPSPSSLNQPFNTQPASPDDANP